MDTPHDGGRQQTRPQIQGDERREAAPPAWRAAEGAEQATVSSSGHRKAADVPSGRHSRLGCRA